MSVNKAKLKILEGAFSAEIESALTGGIPLFQTKSKLAGELSDSGHLNFEKFKLPGHPPLIVEGYILTDLGRVVYCQSCG